MFSYYGSKSKLIDYYPSPKHSKIIEPFAGSARYALRWFDRDVVLVDSYEPIVRLWHYLQQATEGDILGLPQLKKGMLVNSLNLSDEEKLLVGFMAGTSGARPRNKVSSFRAVHFSQENGRRNLWEKLAKDLYKIRHWEIKLGDYRDIPNQVATWFIDPPYFCGGHTYVHNSIDYHSLANWCKSRLGQVIVCENTKADWLPFWPLRDLHGAQTDTTEAVWGNEFQQAALW